MAAPTDGDAAMVVLEMSLFEIDVRSRGFYHPEYASGPTKPPGGETMSWEAPTFEEINMSAEINAYQDDFDREQDDRF
jgi:coenzyme PQQ precursor peptide PqqA